jgi:methyl-accepting chemotaxis protein
MNNTKSDIMKAIIVSCFFPVLGCLFLKSTFPGWTWIQAPFHSLIETAGLFAGLSLAILLLLRKNYKSYTSHYILTASALIGMGILDGFHASAGIGNTFVWLHSIAALCGGFLFSAVWLAKNKTQPDKGNVLPIAVAVSAIIIGIVSFTFKQSLPLMLADGSFTSGAFIINIAGGFLFFAGAVYFLVRYYKNKNIESILFAFFCLLNGSAGLIFWFSQPWDSEWWLWHVLRTMAYIILLGYVFIIFWKTEVELRDTKDKLEVKAELEKTNLELECEISGRKRTEENLKKAILEVQESVSTISSAVSQILVPTTELASISAETSVSVTETTAAVEEVKQTALLSAEKSKNVSDNSQKAALVAEQGNAAVTETMEGMNHIKILMETVAESIMKLSEQTLTIGKIITVVNDLAQQSNLLSVNAAIEASKAGEQGKGFSVVAHEIKSLAEQSKQATEQVRTILEDIQKATSASVLATEQVSKAVDAGVTQAIESGESIEKLSGSIVEASQAAVQIAVSSQQQLIGMEQIVLAMENIKLAAEQSMTGAKQSEQAAQNLNELGLKLKTMVEKYEVN